MILNCVIVDDEPLALELLQSYVQKTSFLQLTGKYSSAIQAMNDLTQKEAPHLMFLDIQMPGLSGLEYSKLVAPETRIVFTTAFEQYALDSYKVHALDYLMKPISYSHFLQAANKALHWFELHHHHRPSAVAPSVEIKNSIFVKSDYKHVQIPFDDILYIEGLKDYVKIHLVDGSKPVLTLLSMKSMEETLPADRFIRVHRSYIVQKNKIKVIDRGRIVFGKDYVPVSESYKQDLQDYVNELSIQ